MHHGATYTADVVVATRGGLEANCTAAQAGRACWPTVLSCVQRAFTIDMPGGIPPEAKMVSGSVHPLRIGAPTASTPRTLGHMHQPACFGQAQGALHCTQAARHMRRACHQGPESASQVQCALLVSATAAMQCKAASGSHVLGAAPGSFNPQLHMSIPALLQGLSAHLAHAGGCEQPFLFVVSLCMQRPPVHAVHENAGLYLFRPR